MMICVFMPPVYLASAVGILLNADHHLKFLANLSTSLVSTKTLESVSRDKYVKICFDGYDTEVEPDRPFVSGRMVFEAKLAKTDGHIITFLLKY